MVWISNVYDKINSILLSEGTLPDISVHVCQSPCGPPGSSIEVPPVDTLAAWYLTTHTEQYVQRSTYQDSLKGELHTWILGPALGDGAALAERFVDKPKNHRVILHRQPSVYDGKNMWENVWAPAHNNLPIRHARSGRKQLQQDAEPFMQKILRAYAMGHEAVEAVMDASGHSYVFARADEA